MKIKKTIPRRLQPPPSEVQEMSKKILDATTNEALLKILQGLPTSWIYPSKGDLFHWVKVLDKFDEVLEKECSIMDLATKVNPQVLKNKVLIIEILKFTRMLFENCTNRSVYNSYEHLHLLLKVSDLDVVEMVLRALLKPAQRMSNQKQLRTQFSAISQETLQIRALHWGMTEPLSVLGATEVANIDSRFSFQFYKAGKKEDGLVTLQNVDVAKYGNNLVDIFNAIVEKQKVPIESQFSLLHRIQVALSLSVAESRQKMMTVRLLALSVLSYVMNEENLNNIVFMYEPRLIYELADLLHPDKKISWEIRSVALYALDGFLNMRGKFQEVLQSLNVSANHGIITYIFRRILSNMESFSEVEYPMEFIEALFLLIAHMITSQSGGNAIISAGLVQTLVKFFSCHDARYLKIVSKCITILDNLIYGYQNSFAVFCSAEGLGLLVDRIKTEVAAIDSTTDRVSLIKISLKFVYHMMHSLGSAEGLRNLIEGPLPLLVKEILTKPDVFGPSIFSVAVNIFATFIHNEPTVLPILQELELPNVLLTTITSMIPVSSDVLSSLGHAFSAICLNSSGLALFSEMKPMKQFLMVLVKQEYLRAVTEADVAVSLGNAVDEFIRHQPSLKDDVFDAILNMLDQLEVIDSQLLLADDSLLQYCKLAVSKEGEELSPVKMAQSFPADETNRETLSASIITQICENIARFLEGLFQHQAHCREFITLKGVEKLMRIYKLGTIPYDFAASTASYSVSHLFRVISEVNPSAIIPAAIDELLPAFNRCREFMEYQGEPSYFAHLVDLDISNTATISKAQDIFRSLITVHGLIGLMSDLYCSQSLSFSRTVVSIVQAFATNDAIKAIEEMHLFHRACVWEHAVYKREMPRAWLLGKKSDKKNEKDDKNDNIEKDDKNDKIEKDDNSDKIENSNGPDSLIADPYDRRVLNTRHFKFLLSQIPSCLIPLMSGIGKMLYTRRTLDVQGNERVAKALASNLVKNLEWQRSENKVVSHNYYEIHFGQMNVLFFDDSSAYRIQLQHYPLFTFVQDYSGMQVLKSIFKRLQSEYELESFSACLEILMTLLSRLCDAELVSNSNASPEPQYIVNVRSTVLSCLVDIWGTKVMTSCSVGVVKNVMSCVAKIFDGKEEETNESYDQMKSSFLSNSLLSGALNVLDSVKDSCSSVASVIKLMPGNVVNDIIDVNTKEQVESRYRLVGYLVSDPGTSLVLNIDKIFSAIKLCGPTVLVAPVLLVLYHYLCRVEIISPGYFTQLCLDILSTNPSDINLVNATLSVLSVLTRRKESVDLINASNLISIVSCAKLKDSAIQSLLIIIIRHLIESQCLDFVMESEVLSKTRGLEMKVFLSNNEANIIRDADSFCSAVAKVCKFTTNNLINVDWMQEFLDSISTDDNFYKCFLMQALAELILSYPCFADQMYRLCRGNEFISFLLTNVIPYKTLDKIDKNTDKNAKIKQRQQLYCSHWAGCILGALCHSKNDEIIKYVLDCIGRAIKDSAQKYEKYLSYSDLCYKILFAKFNSENQLVIGRAMIDAKFVHLLTGVMGDVNAHHPQSDVVVSSILRTLEALSRCSVKMSESVDDIKAEDDDDDDDDDDIDDDQIDDQDEEIEEGEQGQDDESNGSIIEEIQDSDESMDEEDYSEDDGEDEMEIVIRPPHEHGLSDDEMNDDMMMHQEIMMNDDSDHHDLVINEEMDYEEYDQEINNNQRANNFRNDIEVVIDYETDLENFIEEEEEEEDDEEGDHQQHHHHEPLDYWPEPHQRTTEVFDAPFQETANSNADAIPPNPLLAQPPRPPVVPGRAFANPTNALNVLEEILNRNAREAGMNWALDFGIEKPVDTNGQDPLASVSSLSLLGTGRRWWQEARLMFGTDCGPRALSVQERVVGILEEKKTKEAEQVKEKVDDEPLDDNDNEDGKQVDNIQVDEQVDNIQVDEQVDNIQVDEQVDNIQVDEQSDNIQVENAVQRQIEPNDQLMSDNRDNHDNELEQPRYEDLAQDNDPGIDPTFLEAIPAEDRIDVLAHYFDERYRTALNHQPPALSQTFLASLNEEIRHQVETQERLARERYAQDYVDDGEGDDPAIFFATLDPELRAQILIEQDEELLATLPPMLAEEAQAARERNVYRDFFDVARSNIPATIKKPTVIDSINIIDKQGVHVLLKCLLQPESTNRKTLVRLLSSLCHNSATCEELINGLLQHLFSKNRPSKKAFAPYLVPQRCLEVLLHLANNHERVVGILAKEKKGKVPLVNMIKLLKEPLILEPLMELISFVLHSVIDAVDGDGSGGQVNGTGDDALLQSAIDGNQVNQVDANVNENNPDHNANANQDEANPNDSIVTDQNDTNLIDVNQNEQNQPGQAADSATERRACLIKHLNAKAIHHLVNAIAHGDVSTKAFSHAIEIVTCLCKINLENQIVSDVMDRLGQCLGKTFDDLEYLLVLMSKQSAIDIQGVTLDHFSSFNSNQSQLLRLLKTLDNVLKKDSEDLAKLAHEHAIINPLSKCLSMVGNNSELFYVATVLLPSIESVFLMCKRCASLMDKVFHSFTEEHRKLLNAMIRNNSSLLSDTFVVLIKNPKNVDFDNKRTYFRQQLKKKNELRLGQVNVTVSRQNVFEGSFRIIMNRTADELKYGKLNVRFAGEEGVDAGGVTREWFSVLSRQMFNPDYALFKTSAVDKITYQPNRASWVNPDHLFYFRFVGRIIGKAIYEGRLLDCYFTRSFYKHILGIPVDYKDMEAIDPEFYKSLLWILENDITDILDLTLSTESDDFGKRKIVDLVPNGRNLPVTEQNKVEYVRLITENRLTTAIEQQITAFKQGFYEIIPHSTISVFNEQELELLISGLPDIDIDDWKNNTEYQGYTLSSPVIQWFWRAVRSFSQEERAKLIQFATGTSKVPLEGFAHLQGSSGVQKFQIHKAFGSVDRLPSAHTCFNQLDMPEYDSYDKLREFLLLAINECTGFGFS